MAGYQTIDWATRIIGQLLPAIPTGTGTGTTAFTLDAFSATSAQHCGFKNRNSTWASTISVQHNHADRNTRKSWILTNCCCNSWCHSTTRVAASTSSRSISSTSAIWFWELYPFQSSSTQHVTGDRRITVSATPPATAPAELSGHAAAATAAENLRNSGHDKYNIRSSNTTNGITRKNYIDKSCCSSNSINSNRQYVA